MLKILIDADMIVFRACSSVETEINWYGDMWTLHSDLAEVKAKIDEMVNAIVTVVLDHYKVNGSYEIMMCLSSKKNFRKKIFPAYKLNREGKRKPLAYSPAVKWLKESYNCKEVEGLEADDIIGITATTEENCVIISGDKDMRSLPAKFYDFFHNEFYETTEKEADYWFYYQTLVGDTADNYKGCPKIGAVGAKKILDKETTWEAVVNAYVKAGQTEDDALLQARCARILRASDYDKDNKSPILWTPESKL